MATNWPTTWPSPSTELHSFDPNGDVLFVLSRWPDPDENNSSDGEYDDDSEISSSEEGEDDEEVMTPEQVSDPHPDPTVTNNSGALGDSQVSQPLEDDHLSAAGVNLPSDSAAPEDDQTSQVLEDNQISIAHTTTSESVPTTVHMRASSRHLMLASSTFLSMIGPGYREGSVLQAQGSVVIPLGDDDPDALIILLNIIHGKTRMVPREVDLHTLAKIAALVDYYRMHETVELWSDLWIEKVGLHEVEDEHDEFSQPCILKRLFISWVFQKADAFKTLSQHIEYVGTEELCWEYGSEYEVDLEDLDKLPIPPPILDAINANRAAAIKGAIKIIHDLVQKYTEPTVHCPHGGFKCDATVLGSVIKNAAEVCLWPPPDDYDAPFTDVTDAIRSMEIVTSCTQAEGEAKFEHGVDSFIEASLLAIEDGLCGLDIEDFIPKDRVKLQPQLWSPAATELHIFGPEGDVLFILNRSALKNDTAEEDDAEFEHLDLMMIDDDDDAIIPEPATNMGVDFDIETELPSHIRVTKANRVFTLLPAESASSKRFTCILQGIIARFTRLP
ncbi:hypothetical protein ACEPPN_009921 [Leptodophora sp. 'Broadleaf-Isolate-01']